MQLKIPFMARTLEISMGEQSGKWQTAGESPLMAALGNKSVTEEKALHIDAVYACVQLYARTLAALPLMVYKMTDKGKERATDHYLYRLLHDEPNPNMTSYVFREIMEASLKLWGNAYAWIEYDENWRAKYLWPLPPDSVFPQRSLKTGELFYDVMMFDSSRRVCRSYEILHIPGLGFDGIKGRSPIRQTAETMGLSLSIKSYGNKFFENGARPSGILEHPGNLSEPAQERLINKFDKRYSGIENSAKTMLLEEGMKYVQVGIPPEEAQFLESRKYSVTEIARIYGVPPHMIGDLDRATFSNIESQDINFAKHTIMPECVRWEKELMKKLLTAEERQLYEIEFLMDGLVRGDMQSRYQAYAIGRQWGFLNTNDIRAKENMNFVEGGETYFVPLNMIASDQAAAYWQSRIDAQKVAKGGEKNE